MYFNLNPENGSVVCVMSGDVKSDGDGAGEGVVRSEDELGVKWDRCVADTIIKTGGN